MKSVYAFIHYAFGGVKAPSISVLGSSTSTTGAGQACSAATRVPPRRPSLGIPFWLVWPFSVPHTRLHLMPRLAASGPISRLGPLSLLHWVFLLRPVRLSARSMGFGADGRAFPSAVDLVYCHRFQYVFSFSYNFRGVPAYRGGRTFFPTAVEYIAKSTFPYFFPFLVCVFADRM